MKNDTSHPRLSALDGLRGIAILLVFLNHVSVPYITALFPPEINNMLFASGITGVSLLFILSGFFMSALYPHPTNALAFLQKRYTRIFPLFLTLVSVMLFLRLNHTLPFLVVLLVILAAAVVTHIFWVYGVKKYASVKIKRAIFISFLILQFLTALYYIFVIMHHPAVVFNQQYPPLIREGIIGLVNATLTLPFGDYIPMLDGVYWSLVAEVLFYILYPILCVPLIHFFAIQKRSLKILGLLLLFPFFLGLDMLVHKLFVLSMLQLSLCFYFLPGILLGYFYRTHTNVIASLHQRITPFLASALLILFFLLLFAKPLVIARAGSDYYSLINILWAFPLCALLLLALDSKTLFARFLGIRPFVFLGMISYSIYLSHTAILHVVERTLPAANLFTNILVLLVTFAVTVALSWLLFVLLEKPYFMKTTVPKAKVAPVVKLTLPGTRRLATIFGVLTLCLGMSIFSAYQSRFNLFSLSEPLSQGGGTMLSLQNGEPFRLTVHPTHDNLAIITAHLRRQTNANETPLKQTLSFKIQEASQKTWLGTNTYKVGAIKDDPTFPFGFPLIADAKDKTYILELQQTSSPTYEYITLDPGSFTGVYQVDKKALFKNPPALMQFLANRLTTVYRQPQAQLTSVLLLPFIVLGFTLVFYKSLIDKKKANKYNDLA